MFWWPLPCTWLFNMNLMNITVNRRRNWSTSQSGVILVVFIIFLKVHASSITALVSTSDKYYLSVDAGTESLRVGLFDHKGKLLASEATSYVTTYPHPGWFEQNPDDWWENLGTSCRKTLAKARKSIENFDEDQIVAMCCDTTACSVLMLDESMQPLRPCLLWADSRSSKECEEILQKAKGDPALSVNCGGAGPLSAEWMIPKALWLKHNEGDLWKEAYVCECQDWINYKLTGRYVASGCNVAARWHFNAEEACSAEKGSLAGRPVSLLKAIGLEDILHKWPQECIGMGELIGGLTGDAAAHLGLPSGLKVVQGGPDAYVGMIGLGVCKPGSLALITGSSHLHLAISDNPITHKGIWGCYKGAPIKGLCFAEGGQSSTGSMITWLKRLLGEGTGKEAKELEKLGFRQLDAECENSPPGARGLLCVETFQGSRTPVTDAKARGAFVGLTLGHSRGDIWRAALESICFGTKAAIEAMEEAGMVAEGNHEIAVSGGATRSPTFLQMHADITGKTIVVGETDNAVLLGGAILARVGGDSNIQDENDDSDDATLRRVSDSIADMVREAKRVYPDESKVKRYKSIYSVYRRLSKAIKETNQILTDNYESRAPLESAQPLNLSSSAVSATSSHGAEGLPLVIHQPIIKKRQNGITRTYVVPSILAADFGNLASEARLCGERGCVYIHVDVCDGGESAQRELTIGPQAIAAIKRANPDLKLDVHVVASKPGHLIKPLGAAGAERLTVQYECLKKATKDDGGSDVALYGLVKAFAMAVNDAGMKFGLSIAPDTPVEEVVELVRDLLNENLIEFLDILAVKPGKGGQEFDQRALGKLQYARKMLPALPFLGIDGGVSHRHGTAKAALDSGANVLIAGSAIFTKDRVVGENDAEVRSNIDAMVEIVLNS